MRFARGVARGALVLALSSCGGAAHDEPPAHPHDASGHGHAAGHRNLVAHGARAPAHDGPAPTHDEAALAAVAAIHGGHGPWAVAGYRMGEAALTRLGLPRGSFDLTVEHLSPREVQYTCIADGAAAATGASTGKLNLTLGSAPEHDTRTVYTRKSTGQSVTLRLTAAFKARYLDVPRERLGDAGREVMSLRDDEIFEVAQP